MDRSGGWESEGEVRRLWFLLEDSRRRVRRRASRAINVIVSKAFLMTFHTLYVWYNAETPAA